MRTTALSLLAVCLSIPVPAFAQAPTPGEAAIGRAADAAEKAAAAAQRAAEAAQSAAESAAKSAAAVERAAAAAAAAAPAAPAAAKVVEGPKPVEPPKPSVWTGVVGLGLIAITGNAEALTFKGTGAFERKTTDWIYGVKANAVYGQGRAAGAVNSEVNALAASVQARGDRRFTEQLSAFLIAGVETDHVKSIESRPYGEAGVSLIWWDTKEGELAKSHFRTDLGFRYGHEYRFQYYPTPQALPGVDIIAPHLGALLRYGISKDVLFTQDADLVGNLVGEPRLMLTTNSKLAARLTAAMSLGVTFSVTYDSVPPPGRRNTDTSLSVGIEVGL